MTTRKRASFSKGWIQGLLVGLAILPLVPVPAFAAVLLIFDSTVYDSRVDCEGSAKALLEAGVPHTLLDLQLNPLTTSALESRSVLIACHLALDGQTAAAISTWVEHGGGLLASGQTGRALKSLLGLAGLDKIRLGLHSEIQFVLDHPASTGAWWSGPITQSPPMPLEEMPLTMRHYYFTGHWPAFSPHPGDAEVLATWGDWDNWQSAGSLPAITVHGFGAGRALYSGALPGAYVSWDWPRTWQTWLVTAVAWLSGGQRHVELGNWPYGHRAALSWTGDTETAAMRTAVPSLLAVFEALELDRFGTFYVVGRSDPELPGNEGAAENPDIVALIAASGAEVGGHGDIHMGFRCEVPGQCGADELTAQRDRLSEMRDLILLPLEPAAESLSGFRAPFLEFEQITLQALDNLGFHHDSSEADFWAQTTLPFPVSPELDLLQLPPTMLMDWHLLIRYGLGPEVAEAHWIDKLDYILARRGLFTWLHHPWIIEHHLELVARFLSRAQDRGDIWFARQDDIAAWWRQRSQVRLSLADIDESDWLVTVKHEGNAPIEGVSIWIRLPDGQDCDCVALLDDGQTLSLIGLKHAGSRFRIAVLPTLAAREQRQVRVLLDPMIFRDRFEPDFSARQKAAGSIHSGRP